MGREDEPQINDDTIDVSFGPQLECTSSLQGIGLEGAFSPCISRPFAQVKVYLTYFPPK